MKGLLALFVGLLVLGVIGYFGFIRGRSAAVAVPSPEVAMEKPAIPPPPPPEVTLPTWRLTWTTKTLPAAVAVLTKNCETGLLIDGSTGDVLWHKSESEPVEIASMTKMMTALLLMETIQKEKRFDLQTMIPVSPTAAKIGGSQVYLDPKESFSLDDLLKCIMIFSANDAAELIAEYLGQGSAETFIAMMNQRAQELGLLKMKFYNAHGLPPGAKAPENMGTSLELAFLAKRLMEYPEVVHWSSTWIDYIRKGTPKQFQLVNRNKLVLTCPGVNGMKTGYTRKSRFCVAATCERNGRLVIAVVTGCPSAAARNQLVTALLNWAYAQLPPAPVVTKPTPAAGTSMPPAAPIRSPKG